MNILIVLIVLFILALLLVIKYNKIDTALFGYVRKDAKYVPFGQKSILASAACGAVMAVGVVMKKIFNMNWEVEGYVVAGILLLIIVVSYNVYRSFTLMPTMGSAIGKSIFLLCTSIIGAAVGVVGSLIIIGLLILYLILMVFTGALSGGNSTTSSYNNEPEYDATTTDESGFERKLRESGSGYIDDKGDRWKSSGYNEVTRDD